MYIPLDRDSSQPLTRQISGYLEELIRRGHVGPGGRLPPTRTLAADLGVNKKTVEAAYEELETRGLVRVRAGRGVTVRGQIPEDPALELGLREPRQRDPLPRDAWLSPAPEPGRILDLAGVGPRVTNLTSRQLRLFHEEALAASRGPLFAPPPPLGESSLRAAASRHLARCGVLLSPDEVAVVPGREAAMGRLLHLFVARRGTVLADRLLDPELALAVREHRARLVVLPPEEGERELASAVRRVSPRLLVVATGASRLAGSPPGPSRRRELLDLAREKAIPVVEDVTHTEWLQEPPVPPPLAVLDRTGRVLPLCDLSDEAGGAFSAAVVGATPKALDRLRQVPGPAEKALDRLAQSALAQALDAPARIRTLRAVREKRRMLVAAITRSLRRRLGEASGFAFSPGADAVRVGLPPGVGGTDVQDAARDRGVLVRTARDCGAPPSGDGFLLLDLTRHDEGDLLDGIRLLGEALDEVLERE